MLRDLLDFATPSLRVIAREARVGYFAIRQYRRGQRTPAADVLRRLAGVCRRRAQRLVRMAESLERAAQHEPRRRP